ncbi:hypothetical protein KI387_021350, partial [Taxus chinensis]
SDKNTQSKSIGNENTQEKENAQLQEENNENTIVQPIVNEHFIVDPDPAKWLAVGLLGVESGQDAVIRALLSERKSEKVEPYSYTVAEFTDFISTLRNNLGHTPVVDEGLVVDKRLGAEGLVKGNILACDKYSVAHARTPAQILRIVYSSGSESVPGGFYSHG